MLYNLIEKNPLQAETQHLGFQAKTNISLLKIASLFNFIVNGNIRRIILELILNKAKQIIVCN